MKGLLWVALFLFALQLQVTCSEHYVPEQVLEVIETFSDSNEEDVRMWRKYIQREQLHVDEVRELIGEAATEFNVPKELLESIAYLENNWIHIGPSIDRGWGMMHLVRNENIDTLGKAAELLGLDIQVLKDDAEQNIRGAAALLSFYAGTDKTSFTRLEDWFEAVKKISGLPEEELQEEQAFRYYSILRKGVSERNLFNQDVRILAERGIDLEILKEKFRAKKQAKDTQAKSTDYPDAKNELSKYNHNNGRSHKIDTWVNHWIGVGTYAGAVSWFKNSKAKASAHFVIRHSDGEISQVIRVKDTAWHCGSKASKYNNSRSIGIEFEATVTHPEWWNSKPMIQNGGKIIKYFCEEYSIPKKRALPGIREHDEMPGCNTACAGNINWEGLMDKIAKEE